MKKLSTFFIVLLLGLTGVFSQSGCIDSTACNYDPDAIMDDGSCIVPDDCQSCCVFSDGTWTNEHLGGLDGMNPTISGSGDNWELLSAAWISTDETDNGDGTVTSTAQYGADDDNYSKLIFTIPCLVRSHSINISNNQII